MRHHTKIKSGDVVWSKLKILVFSQDEAFRFMVRSTFRKLGVADVLSTGQVEDAEHLAGHSPNITLVDFEGGGTEALGFLIRLRNAPRNNSPGMPVLVAARGGSTGVSADVLNMGIAGIVPKPTSSHELTVRVAQTLKGTQSPAPAPAPPASAPGTGAVRSVAPAKPAPAPTPTAALPAIRPAAPLPTIVRAATPPASPAPAPAPPPRAAPPARPDIVEHLPVKPAGGRLSDADLAGTPPKQTYEVARPDDEAERRKAKARQDAWTSALEKMGHRARTGADVAKFDVAAIVAAHLSWLQTQGADGQRANVQGMDLAGADLARTVLANATFRESDLSDSSLAEARLDGGDFRYAKLDAANLQGANLGVAQLRHAKLRLANLEGSILRGADLSGADLRGALLAGADIKGAVLISTDLRGTDLSQVENMAQAQANRAVTDMKTKLPPGIRRAIANTDA